MSVAKEMFVGIWEALRARVYVALHPQPAPHAKAHITFPKAEHPFGSGGSPSAFLITGPGMKPLLSVRNPETGELENVDIAPGGSLDLGGGVALEFGPFEDDDDGDDDDEGGMAGYVRRPL